MARLVIGTSKAATTAGLVKEPAHYVAFEVDANGTPTPPYSATKTTDFSGIKTLNSRFASAYNGCTHITTADLSDVESITGGGSCFLDCTGLTYADLSSVKDISGASGMFKGCTSLTSVNLGSLQRVIGAGANAMFQGCTSLTTVTLGAFTTSYRYSSSGSCCSSMFKDCTSLVSLDLSGLSSSTDLGSMCSSMCQGCTSLVSVDLHNLTKISGSYSFQYAFSGCSSLQSVDLSGLMRIEGNYYPVNSMFTNCTSLTSFTFQRLNYFAAGNTSMFSGCSNLRELRFPGLALRSAIPGSITSILSGCSNVTAHFPAEWETLMSQSTAIMNGMGGTNTTVLFDLPNVRIADLSFLTKAVMYFQMNSAFSGCTEITSVDARNITEVAEGALNSAFSGCTALTSINFSALRDVLNSTSAPFSSTFSNCTALTTVEFPSLVNISSSFGYCFTGCTALTSISFPALKTTSAIVNSAFSNMFNASVSGCTLHFPSNMSTIISRLSGYPNFGGTNTTVLFDLPATE